MLKKGLELFVLFTVLFVAAILIAACGGVSQSDYDAAKQALAAQDQRVQSLQSQLSSKEKEIADLKKQPTGGFSGTTLIGAVPAPTRAPAPSPTPLPPGFTPPPPPSPPAAKLVPLYAYVDTVTSGMGESQYNVDPNLSCLKTSVFKRGMHVVWRMEVADTSLGKILQGADVKDAAVKLPDGKEFKFRYARHGSTADSPWFWTAAWDVPPDYPLGVIDYAITVTTVDGKSTTIKDPLPVSNPDRKVETRLTIVP